MGVSMSHSQARLYSTGLAPRFWMQSVPQPERCHQSRNPTDQPLTIRMRAAVAKSGGPYREDARQEEGRHVLLHLLPGRLRAAATYFGQVTSTCAMMGRIRRGGKGRGLMRATHKLMQAKSRRGTSGASVLDIRPHTITALTCATMQRLCATQSQ